MSTPKKCPVCGNDLIRPISRAVLVKVESQEVPGVLAYRCGEGHLFLVATPEEKTKKRAKRADASS